MISSEVVNWWSVCLGISFSAIRLPWTAAAVDAVSCYSFLPRSDSLSSIWQDKCDIENEMTIFHHEKLNLKEPPLINYFPLLE
jgi:hypothetical protein